MENRKIRNILRRMTAFTLALALAAVSAGTALAASGEDVLNIEDPNAPAAEEDGEDDSQGGGLIEDNGADVSIKSGVSESEVQEAIASEQAARDQLQALISDTQVTLLQADRNQISEYLTNLTSEVNPAGSYEEMDMAAYIEDTMSALGYRVTEQNFHEGVKDSGGIDQPAINIIAERLPNTEESTDDVIILTAHYDAKAQPGVISEKKQFAAEAAGQTEAADEAATYHLQNDPLANDKNGAAVMLETARILADINSSVDVAFVFLSGEEDGYYGSSFFISDTASQFQDRIRAVICLDRIGYYDLPVLLGTSNGLANEPAGMIEAAAESLNRKSEALTVENESEDTAVSDGSAETAENGTGTETAGQTETATEEPSVYEAEENTDELTDWSLVTASGEGTAQNFIASGFTTVSVSQDESRIYEIEAKLEAAEAAGTDTAEAAGEEAATEALSEEEADGTSSSGEAVTEKAGESGTESEETETSDTLEPLVTAANVLAHAVAGYMKPTQSGFGTIPQ